MADNWFLFGIVAVGTSVGTAIGLIVWWSFRGDKERTLLTIWHVAAAFLIGAFLYAVRRNLPPFILAGAFSLFVEPLVSALQRWKLSRGKSILVVYVFLLASVVLIVMPFIPQIVQQTHWLAAEIPQFITNLQSYPTSIHEFLVKYNLPAGIERSLVSIMSSVEEAISSLGDNIFSSFLSSAAKLAYLVVIPTISYYILRDINSWRRRSLAFMDKYPVRYGNLVRDIDRVLVGFIRGQTIVALSVMAMVWIVASVLQLPYAAVLGLVSGLGEFVPFFGPLVGAIPILLVALAQSPAKALWTLGLVIVIQWVDSNIIVPRVTGPRVGLHPLWVIFAILAGGGLLGLWGVLLAVPMAGIAGAFVKCIMAQAPASPTGLEAGSDTPPGEV